MAGGRDVDELTQDIFVRVWQKLATFRGDSAFGTWLHRLAVNVIIERFRTEATRRQRFYDGEAIFETLSAPPRPRDISMDFETALEKLPDGAREIFVLHDVEGYKHRRDRIPARHLTWHVEGAAAPCQDDAAPASGLRNSKRTKTRRRTHMHEAVNDRLSEYVDDELSATERATVEQHLQTCARCRADVDGLRAVVARARTLSDTPPATTLWPGIVERIDGRAAQPAPAGVARRFSFTLPQLIAAGLALMVLSGSMVWLARLGGPRTDIPPVAAESDPAVPVIAPVNVADDAYDDAIADLQRTLDAGRSRLDPQTLRILQQNLETIDRAITQCREALASDPTNGYLSAYLASARARKLELLRHATRIIDRTG